MLQIDRLRKSYRQSIVLQDLSLSVQAGQIYGLLGPNGAGKTTTINVMCNLVQADQGTVQINGMPVSEQTKRLIGVAPQETLIYRYLSCEENLRFFGSLYGFYGKKRRQRVQDCLAAVGLSDRAASVAETLSGGMQRRLSLAIALMHQPKLLILDEPTTGLDLEARFEVWDLIQRFKQDGMTILLTTHFLEEAERLCDRIGILQQGQIVAEGSLADLRQLIPAQEIVLVQTSEEAAAIARAEALQYPYRHYGRDLALWLPQPLDLKEILAQFEGIPLDSVSRQPVRLEHIYLEIMRRSR